MGAAVPLETSSIAARINGLLSAHNETADLGWIFCEGTPFRCVRSEPDRVLRPDGAFISSARTSVVLFTSEMDCQTVPDLVIEVVAPDDLAEPHMGKVMGWLSAGVQLVWEVFPKSRTVYAMRPDGSGLRVRPNDTLHGEDVLPGFSVPVADLFRVPGEPAPAAAPPVQ